MQPLVDRAVVELGQQISRIDHGGFCRPQIAQEDPHVSRMLIGAQRIEVVDGDLGVLDNRRAGGKHREQMCPGTRFSANPAR